MAYTISISGSNAVTAHVRAAVEEAVLALRESDPAAAPGMSVAAQADDGETSFHITQGDIPWPEPEPEPEPKKEPKPKAEPKAEQLPAKSEAKDRH